MELLRIVLIATTLTNISGQNFEFLTSNNDELQIIWKRPYSWHNCTVKVEGLDIMNKKFIIKRDASKFNHIKIRKNILQPGSSISVCMYCPKKYSFHENSYCETYVVKPQSINNARCKEEKDRIRFEFDHPHDGMFDNFEIDIEPSEVYPLPRILSKDMDHITFMNLKPGKSYKIIAKTIAGEDEISYSDPVELICTTKQKVNVQASKKQIQSTRSNDDDDEMLLMIQSQTAIMKLVIMMTFVVLLILVMSTFTLSYILRMKRQQMINFKQDCEKGSVDKYRKLEEY